MPGIERTRRLKFISEPRICGAPSPPLATLQMAATAYGSGGGFTPLFNRSNAGWQEQVVSEYLAASSKALPPQSDFAASGRATPDVSMASQGYQVPGGIFGPKSVDGTSASTPAFGAAWLGPFLFLVCPAFSTDVSARSGRAM